MRVVGDRAGLDTQAVTIDQRPANRLMSSTGAPLRMACSGVMGRWGRQLNWPKRARSRCLLFIFAQFMTTSEKNPSADGGEDVKVLRICTETGSIAVKVWPNCQTKVWPKGS